MYHNLLQAEHQIYHSKPDPAHMHSNQWVPFKFSFWKAAVKQRILNTERQRDIPKVLPFLAPLKMRYMVNPATYLSLLEVPSYCRTFYIATARSDIFLSVVVKGWYKTMLMVQQVFLCGTGKADPSEIICSIAVFTKYFELPYFRNK